MMLYKNKKKTMVHSSFFFFFCVVARLARRYIGTVSIYNLPRLCTKISINQMKENGIPLKKRQEADNILLKQSCMWIMQTIYCFSQIYLPKQNVCCVVCSRQQKVLASTWTQMKQNSTISILNDKPLKLVDYFTYLSSNISSTECNDIWSIHKLSILKFNIKSSCIFHMIYKKSKKAVSKYVYIFTYINKLADLNWGWSESFFFDSYYTKSITPNPWLLHLPLIYTL